MRVAVIIPTTDGPAPILRLTRLAQAPRSVLRTQDDYRPLPPSSRYHSFIQAGGPLSGRIGIGDGQFELRLGATVETGRSWELPTALAHWLQSAGHQIDPEMPELVIWATGALDNDLSVLSQDYHLSTKLERSVAHVREWLDNGVPVMLLLPEEVKLDAFLTSPLITVQMVQNLAESIAAIKAIEPEPVDNGSVISALQKPARRYPLRLTGAAILFLTMVLWLFKILPPAKTANDARTTELVILAKPEMEDHAEARNQVEIVSSAAPSPSPQLPRVTEDAVSQPMAPPNLGTGLADLPMLVLEYAPEGANCRSLLFGDGALTRSDISVVDGVFHAVVEGDVCGFGFHLPVVANGSVEIMLPTALADLILPSDRALRFSLAPGEDRRFRLKALLPMRIKADVGLLRSGYERVQFSLVIESKKK